MHRDQLRVSECSAAFVRVEHYASPFRRPRDENRTRDRSSFVKHADRTGINWQTVQKILCAVQWVQNPEKIRSRRSVLLFLLVVLLAKDSMIGKSGFDRFVEIILRFSVGL